MPSDGFVDPWFAWSLVVATVALGAGLLGYLHEINHSGVNSAPEGDRPTRWRDAA